MEPSRDHARSKVVLLARWMAVLPAALAGGILVSIAVVALNRLTIPSAIGLSPDSLLGHLFLGAMSGGVTAGAGIWAGAWVAPSKKDVVGFALALLMVALGGLSLGLALLFRDLWSAYSSGWMMGSAAILAWQMHTGELALFQEQA